MLEGANLRFSADYPGALMNLVEEELDTNCIFIQGAAGDMSVNPPSGKRDHVEYGHLLGQEVLAINEDLTTAVPESPSIEGRSHDYAFESRTPLDNPSTVMLLEKAFFPEFVAAFLTEIDGNTIKPTMSTVLINKQLYFVGVSGEFFCNHAVQLKRRARVDRVIFQGYCNGHHLYFPTIEAAAEGGYGAGPEVAWAPVGTPEQMMDQALIDLYDMLTEEDSSEK
jgi:hypothetical protein